MLKVVNTLQLVYDFGERVQEHYALFYSCLYIRCKILFRKKFVFKYSVYKMLGKRSFSLQLEYVHVHIEIMVIVKKSSPKNLSVDCRSTVGRQLADYRPFVGRQTADRRPTGFARNIGRLSADSRTTVGNVSVTCRLPVGSLSVKLQHKLECFLSVFA